MKAMSAFRSTGWAMFLCLISQLSATADCPNAVTDGLDDYQQHRYHAASDSFEKAISENQNDFRAHYYLGLCMEQLKEYDAANNEFEYALRLNPFSSEGRAAKESLLRISGALAAKKHPADDPKLYQQALNLINHDTDVDKQRFGPIGAPVTAGMPIVNAPGSAVGVNFTSSNSLRYRRNSTFLNSLNPYVFSNSGAGNNGVTGAGPGAAGAGSSGSLYQPSAVPAAGSQRLNANLSTPSIPFTPSLPSTPGYPYNVANYSYGGGARNTPPPGSWGGNAGPPPGYAADQQVMQLLRQQDNLERQLATQNAANDLKAELSTPHKEGEPHLRALGTNLYVRNYKQSDDAPPPEDPPPAELHAKAASLDSPPARAGKRN